MDEGLYPQANRSGTPPVLTELKEQYTSRFQNSNMASKVFLIMFKSLTFQADKQAYMAS